MTKKIYIKAETSCVALTENYALMAGSSVNLTSSEPENLQYVDSWYDSSKKAGDWEEEELL